MEYPDPTGDVGGGTEQTVLNDLFPGKQVNGRELALVRERLLRPLMTMLHGVAASQSWTYVDGIFASFQSHGYAATDSWFVKAKESELLQGPIVTPMGYLCGEISPGTLHRIAADSRSSPINCTSASGPEGHPNSVTGRNSLSASFAPIRRTMQRPTFFADHHLFLQSQPAVTRGIRP
jgi:hypothetical protein